MDDKFPQRKPNRLRNYDYSQNGCYFITICTKDKKHLLSHIKNVKAGFHARSAEKEIVKTPMGYDFEKTLFVTTAKYGVTVDNYIVMPNHVHLLLTFDNNWNAFQSVNENGRAWKPAPTRSTNKIGACGNPPLQKLIGEIKSYTTKLYRERETMRH